MWGPQVLYTLKPYQSTPQAFTSMGRWGAYATPSATTLTCDPAEPLQPQACSHDIDKKIRKKKKKKKQEEEEEEEEERLGVCWKPV